LDLRGWITDRILELLTEPLPHYEQRGWNNPEALRRHIRKGDVLLVDGDNRVSMIIKYLTQSSWSHAALYVGDELLRRGGRQAEEARRAFGEEAAWLMVEALPEGVVASPLSKYIDFNIRLLRPHRLRPDHLKTILEDAVAAIGWRYDLRNVIDLARYLIPVRLVPDRLRRAALHFGSGAPTEVICSSLIAMLFHKVRFPVLPQLDVPGEGVVQAPRRGSVLSRIFGYESSHFTGLFRIRHPSLLTPRDFDLSPYFEIIKFNVIAEGGFDYQRIQWLEEAAADPGEAEHARPYGAAPAPRRGRDKR
jgi:hypothetical protein